MAGTEEVKNNIEAYEKEYELLVETKGKEDPETIKALCRLAVAHNSDVDYSIMDDLFDLLRESLTDFNGDYNKAYELQMELFAICSDTFGEDNTESLDFLVRAAEYCLKMGDFVKAHDLLRKVYELADDDYTRSECFSWIYDTCDTCIPDNDYEKGAEYIKFLFEMQEELNYCYMDLWNSDIACLERMALCYSVNSNLQQSLELNEWLYQKFKEHGDLGSSIDTFDELAHAYFQSGKNERFLELYEQLRQELLGYLNGKGNGDYGYDCKPVTVNMFITAYRAYIQSNNEGEKVSFSREEKIYRLYRETLGIEHRETEYYLKKLAAMSVIYSLADDDGFDPPADMRLLLMNRACAGDYDSALYYFQKWMSSGNLAIQASGKLDEYCIFLIRNGKYEEFLDLLKITARLVDNLNDAKADLANNPYDLQDLEDCVITAELKEALKSLYEEDKDFLDYADFDDLLTMHSLTMLQKAYRNIGDEQKSRKLIALWNVLTYKLEKDLNDVI